MPVTHGPTKCQMQQVGWNIPPCVIPSDFCRMKSDGVGWNVFRSILCNQYIDRKRQYQPCALF